MRYYARITVEIEAESEREAGQLAHDITQDLPVEWADVKSASVDHTEAAPQV